MKPNFQTIDKIVFAVVAILVAIVLALVLFGCVEKVARVSNPAAIYDLNAAEYDAAENHFAGAVAVPPLAYWNDERCQTLLDKRDAFALWSAVTGGLAGAGGISTAATDKDIPQWCIGASSLVFGSVSAGLAIAAKAKTDRFEQYCSTDPPKYVVDLAPMPDELMEHDAGVE
jgi:hypothetical protein